VNFAEALKSKAKVVEANYSSAKSRESKPQEFYLDSAASASMGTTAETEKLQQKKQHNYKCKQLTHT
jgi:hypothetical protein